MCRRRRWADVMEHVTVNAVAARERVKTWKEDPGERPSRTSDVAAILSVAAHDLRNPISAIIASAEILFDQATARLEPSERELLTDILNAADVTLNLIENLLDVATGGSEQLTLSATDIRGIVTEGIALNRALSKRKHVSLSLRRGARIPRVRMDRMKMHRIVDEFLSNAIETAQPGQSIEVNVAMKGRSVEIFVQDQVAGITPGVGGNALPVFLSSEIEPSVRVKRRQDLGLAIIRGIVEAHKGHVRVVETGGTGSMYVVSLPIALDPFSQDARTVS